MSTNKLGPHSVALACVVAMVMSCGGSDIRDSGRRDLGQFPEDFLWGSAIAPYQVEGGLHDTDWFQWEALCESCSGDSADDGPDFLAHYDQDLDAAMDMGHNSFRMGIDWSRIFPTRESFPDNPDAAAVAIYHQIIDAARQRNMAVMLTLVHFALPTWIHDLSDRDQKAGWDDPAIVDDFAQFSAWAAAEYGGDVDLWITINEPLVNIIGGYISGDVPPGLALEVDQAFVAAENMIRGHAAAYDAIHRSDTRDADGDGEAAAVSIAQHSRVFVAKDPSNDRQVEAADMFRYLINDDFLNAVSYGDLDRDFDGDSDDPGDIAGDLDLAGRLDFIGLNYYGITVVIETATDASFPLIGFPLMSDLDNQGIDAPVSDFGWSIYPQGLRTVLDEAASYGLPIIITENGVADAGGQLRPRFLIDHLNVLAQAIDDGLDIDGYLHWTLVDNFEWTAGYCPRFGLLQVDFSDPLRPRTPGPTVEVFKRIIEEGGVAPDLMSRYHYGDAGYCPRLGL